MRVMFRKDAPVAILAFSTVYPDGNLTNEVARLYTTVDHVRRMIKVLEDNIATYDLQMTKLMGAQQK